MGKGLEENKQTKRGELSNNNTQTKKGNTKNETNNRQ
jgi:hypothetical protein